MSYEVAKSELCYKGAFLSVRKDEIVMPDGNTAFREVVERGAEIGRASCRERV